MPKNYRPVALTSHLIKLFERVIRLELVKHIEKLDLLPEGQHGSRSLRSILTQLLAYWDSVLEGLEEDDGVDSIYLDFSKAFDKVETVGSLPGLLPQTASCCGGRQDIPPLTCY